MNGSYARVCCAWGCCGLWGCLCSKCHQQQTGIRSRGKSGGRGGQVYKAVLRDTGEEVAVKVQRPNVEPVIFRDLYIFRQLARFVTPFAMQKLGCNAELIVDEFGEKLLEELDYAQEARNIDVPPPPPPPRGGHLNCPPHKQVDVHRPRVHLQPR